MDGRRIFKLEFFLLNYPLFIFFLEVRKVKSLLAARFLGFFVLNSVATRWGLAFLSTTTSPSSEWSLSMLLRAVCFAVKEVAGIEYTGDIVGVPLLVRGLAVGLVASHFTSHTLLY